MASGGENFDKRCRDFRLWQNRGISEILGGRRLKSQDRCLFNRAIASYERLPSVAFVERHRGQVPLNFDEGGVNVRRFATRAWACGERVRYPTIFPKSLIRYLMTGDGIVANRG